MNPKIIEMQKKLNEFRASKSGSASSTAPSASPASTAPLSAPTPAPVAPVSASPIEQELQKYRASKSAGASAPVEEPKGSVIGDVAKTILSPVATIAARPFQAVAELAGASAEDVDKFSNKYSGGFVAPVPQNYGDIKKDIGRAAETVALGTGAPIAGGALFGAGSSLEKGNDLFSINTAFETALGAGGGKALELIGKPLLNAAGKTIGVITPPILKDIASKGAGAIREFVARHPFLQTENSPVAGAFQKVDDAIVGGAKAVKDAVISAPGKLYPNAVPAVQKHFIDVTEQDFIRPTTINSGAYRKATDIYNDAKSRGIDLEKEATRAGIQADKLVEDGKYATSDVADTVRQTAFDESAKVGRPAIKYAETSVPRVPISDVRAAMTKKVENIPANDLDDADRETLLEQIKKRYSDDSAAARAHPDGYSLTDLHDARIISGKNGKYVPGAEPSHALTAQRSREEGRVFADLFDTRAPESLKAFRQSLERKFRLADYLDQLHTKKVPPGTTKKAISLFTRTAGAMVGGKFGGLPGSYLGAHVAGPLLDAFDTFPNPLKSAILNSLKLEKSPEYKVLVDYIGEEEARRLLQLKLPGTGGSSFKEVPRTLFSTPQGKTTPIKQEAVDVTSVEAGKANKPGTDKRRGFAQKVEAAQENLGPYLRPDEMPVTKMGNVPKPAPSNLPIVTDAPKVYVSPAQKKKVIKKIKDLLEPYLTPEQMPVIDFGSKAKPKKSSLRDIYYD